MQSFTFKFYMFFYSRRSHADMRNSPVKIENSAIVLPQSYKPLANLDQMEDMLKFLLTANRQLPSPVKLQVR